MCCHCLFSKISVEIVAKWCLLLLSTREMPSRVASLYHVIIYRDLASKKRWPRNGEIFDLWTLRGRHGHLQYLSGNCNDGYCRWISWECFWYEAFGWVLFWFGEINPETCATFGCNKYTVFSMGGTVALWSVNKNFSGELQFCS